MVSSIPVQREFLVRFTVFAKAGGPFLSYCIAPASAFSDQVGVQFGDWPEMVDALNRAGLPGSEISIVNDKVYAVTEAQFREIGVEV